MFFASVGEAFIVEDMYDGQNETINSADDVAISPGLDERYKFMHRNRSLRRLRLRRPKNLGYSLTELCFNM